MIPSVRLCKHGVGGQMNQVAAVEERDHLHAGRKNAVVQLLHFLVDRHERRVGLGALAQQHDAGDHVVVIDDLSIRQVPRPRELAQPDLGALLHHGDIAHPQRGAVLGGEHRCFRIS